MKLANKNNAAYMATGGGHGTSIGFANVKGAMDIDLSKFNAIRLDADKNLVTVGAANKLADFADNLYKAGKEIRKQPPTVLAPEIDFDEAPC